MGIQYVSGVGQDPSRSARAFGSNPKGEYGKAVGDIAGGFNGAMSVDTSEDSHMSWDTRRECWQSDRGGLFGAMNALSPDLEFDGQYAGGNLETDTATGGGAVSAEGAGGGGFATPLSDGITGTRVDVQGQ